MLICIKKKIGNPNFMQKTDGGKQVKYTQTPFVTSSTLIAKTDTDARRKSQTNFTCKHECKHLRMCKSVPMRAGTNLRKSANVINHIKRLKKTNVWLFQGMQNKHLIKHMYDKNTLIKIGEIP